MWLEILVANLATNFQDLVARLKNLVGLAPVIGTTLHPDKIFDTLPDTITVGEGDDLLKKAVEALMNYFISKQNCEYKPMFPSRQARNQSCRISHKAKTVSC